MSILEIYELLREYGNEMEVRKAVHLHDEYEKNEYVITYRGVMVGSELVDADSVRYYIKKYF